MKRPPSARSRRTPPRGEITWVGLLMLAGVVAAGYLAYVWFPLYFVHYEVEQVVRDHMNQAIKNRSDDQLVRNMAAKIRSLDTVPGEDEQGRPVELPAVPLDASEVLWERDSTAEPPVLRVAFEYTREVTYPVLHRTAEKTFTVDLSQPLERADWGPMR